MGVLRVAAAVATLALGGCYEPELRDCTLTCSSAADCADGQVCGEDHLCAAPGLAGRCASLPTDAGSDSRDAGVDARTISDARPDSSPDAPTHATLTITIDAQGRVTVLGIGTCDKAGPQNGTCMFPVPLGALVTVQAQGYPDWRFDKWTTPACITTKIATCTFTASTDTPVGVKFNKD
jgi:hypothetical protein